MVKWLIENKDWFVPLATLLCAAFGGWWAGKKRIGIEVLSKNRQEWINTLRIKVSDVETNIFVFTNFLCISSNSQNSNQHAIKEKLDTISYKITADLLFIELLLSPKQTNCPKQKNSLINNIKSDIDNFIMYIPFMFYKKKLRITSNNLMVELNNLLILTREKTFIDLKKKYYSMIYENQAPNQNIILEELRTNFENMNKEIHDKAKNLIAIEWQRIKRAK